MPTSGLPSDTAPPTMPSPTRSPARISGMWQTVDPFPLIVQPEGVDSLEPQYSCRAASSRFNAIKSGSNPQWQQHLEASADLFRTLDGISRHHKCPPQPLPCRRDNGSKSSTCVTQESTEITLHLEASAASFGVWVGELTTHLRDFMAGSTDVVYFHNVAHNGSLSRLLSILQLDEMVWPGMGAEVVFELYERKAGQQPWPQSTLALDASDCMRNDTVCHALYFSSQTALSPLGKSKSNYYLRVLLGGRPLKSSHPALGVMDMTPIETVLEYQDGLVGTGAANMVRSRCEE
ncbi:Histidine acid phosphatase family protein [Ophiocordyceps sinensis CO18]|uniref:Histidine acid phosphatase family protein n=1 Tax=Ophiocordyceps sinensis (strain Co18 / CGMCC 3.14243) TaxID=911162 RepID=T5A6B9_OPHSC|nr:Histidine acid phosphatase family protein [Ophiocordyceps sinensis CO18]